MHRSYRNEFVPGASIDPQKRSLARVHTYPSPSPSLRFLRLDELFLSLSFGQHTSSSVFRATLLFLRRSLALFLVFSLSLRSPTSRRVAAAAATRAREKGEKQKEREGERDRGEKKG